MIIDTHTHVWVNDPEKYPWQPVGGYIPEKNAPATSLIKVLDEAGVDRAVLVQPTPYGWDNAYMLAAAREYPERFRTVCLVDPHSPEAAEALERLVQKEAVKGVRIHWTLEPGQMWADELNHRRLWAAAQDLEIPVCLHLSPDQLGLAGLMAGEYPDVRVVLDHLGRPKPGSAPDGPAFQDLLALAGQPNCFVKLSGMHYYSREKVPFSDTWEMLRAVVRAFGAQRCLFGSDFPFVLDHWTYDSLLACIRDQIGFTGEQVRWILGGTASSLGW